MRVCRGIPNKKIAKIFWNGSNALPGPAHLKYVSKLLFMQSINCIYSREHASRVQQLYGLDGCLYANRDTVQSIHDEITRLAIQVAAEKH